MNPIKTFLSRWFHFHEWEYVKEYYGSIYMDERITESWNRWRRCKTCGLVEESLFCSAGSYWNPLTEAQQEIFYKKQNESNTENNELPKV